MMIIALGDKDLLPTTTRTLSEPNTDDNELDPGISH